MNIKDRIIKEVKGVSFRVITESGKERTVSYIFTNVDKSEITAEYNDTTNKYQLSVNIEGRLLERGIDISMNNRCPKCGSDMYNSVLDSCPPLYMQRCTNCGWTIRSGYNFALNNPCKTCPNHTQNGGSGVCACTLGMPKIN